jgi:hypothetical protein
MYGWFWWFNRFSDKWIVSSSYVYNLFDDNDAAADDDDDDDDGERYD